MRRIFFLLMLTGMFCISASTQGKNTKQLPELSADELVAKHLASIGKRKDLDALRSIALFGEAGRTEQVFGDTSVIANAASATSKPLSKSAQLASEGKKFSLVMLFPKGRFSNVRIIRDGTEEPDELKTSQLKGAFYSPILIKQSLLGGVLTTGWPLYAKNAAGLKLESAAAEKIDGRLLYCLKYTDKGGSTILLYFDPANFRHVRSQYKIVKREDRMAPSITSPTNRAYLIYEMTEEFSDFKTTGNLTLPFDYRIRVSTNNRTVTWLIKFNEAYINQDLNQNMFKE